MKICFVDTSEIRRYAQTNMRLFDFNQMFNVISTEEGEDEMLEFHVYANYSSEKNNNKNSKFLEKLALIRSKFNERPNRKFKIINSFNSMLKRNLPGIVILNEMYQDYIESKRKPNQHILVTTSTQYMPTAEYIQAKSKKKSKLYIPNDFPFTSQVADIFELGKPLDLDANKKTIEDIIVLKQIFENIKWAEEHKILFSVKKVVSNGESHSGIAASDTNFMIGALLNAGIIDLPIGTYEGSTYKGITIKDKEKANQFLSELGIRITF